MSKGKKAKPAKKGAAKSKPARSKPAKKNSPEVELAAEESAPEAEAAEASAPEGAAVEASSDEAAQSEGDEATEAAEGAEAAEAETETPVEAASPEDAAAAEAPTAIGADEAVETAGEQPPSDDDAPIEPQGPDTPVAELPRADQKRLVESLVFVSDRAISAQQLSRMLKIKSALAKELADELITDYAGRGIELVELSNGYQFRSAASSAHVVREHIAQPPVRLTRAQLETLALVAYRQPITRPEIDDVRGVDSGSALRVLLERGLLKMLGRKDEPGRPLLYGTTPFFLDFFGMRSLKDLPTLREFTELSEENRALFKKKTGETIEEAEAALLAAEEAAQRDSLAAPSSNVGDADEPPPPSDESAGEESAPLAASEGEPEAEAQAEPTDRDLEVEAETFAAGSLQTSPDSAAEDAEREEEPELDDQELPQAPEA